MNTETITPLKVVTDTTECLEYKLHRIGLCQTQPDVWTWMRSSCRVILTLPDAHVDAPLRALWTDGRFTDVTFFDHPCREASHNEVLVWLNWYLSGGRLNEHSTIDVGRRAHPLWG